MTGHANAGPAFFADGATGVEASAPLPGADARGAASTVAGGCAEATSAPAEGSVMARCDALLLSLFSLRTLPEEQRRVWRAVFDHLIFRLDGDPVAHLPEGVQGVLGEVDAVQFERMRATLLQNLAPRT